MIIEIKVPTPGESITEVEIAHWHVKDGDIVSKDQELFEVESEKATLNVTAEASGKIEILKNVRESIKVGAIACKIDTAYANNTQTPEIKKQDIQKVESPKTETEDLSHVKITPLAKKLMQEKNLNLQDIINGYRRIFKEDVELIANLDKTEVINDTKNTQDNLSQNDTNKTNVVKGEKEVVKMSAIRRKIAERLVAVKNETAMLTTFNELDMSALITIRKQFQEIFVKKYGVKIGYMSFFVKAATNALMLYPEVNASIDGENIVYHRFADIGVAVQSQKGLVVPVLRDTENMSLADIELKIKEFGQKGMANKLSIDEMTGGTFTITNGGIFGSLLSTPIINPPQSGILGMHNIVERPVAVNQKVEIRPMMYIALSYDHRIIDGKSAVSFLIKIKEQIENPVNMLLQNKKLEEILLGI